MRCDRTFLAHRSMIPLLLAVIVIGAVLMTEGKAAEPEDKDLAVVLGKTIEIAKTVDAYKACEYLEASGEPLVVTKRYFSLIGQLCFKEKNIPLMVSMGEAGIHFALREADLLSKTDVEGANQLRGLAKAMSYNLGVNTWPGWNDEGVVIDETARQPGYQAALFNRRMAAELGRAADAVGNAEWLVGAHQLAAGELDAAKDSFGKAAAKFNEAEKNDMELMAKGYAALTNLLTEESKSAGEAEWTAVKKELESLGTDDARFFIEQIEVARTVFETK